LRSRFPQVRSVRMNVPSSEAELAKRLDLTVIMPFRAFTPTELPTGCTLILSLGKTLALIMPLTDQQQHQSSYGETRGILWLVFDVSECRALYDAAQSEGADCLL
jgi:hypothetical protein